MPKLATVVFDAFGTLFQDTPAHWNAAMESIIRQQELDVSVKNLNRAWLEACGGFRTTRSQPGVPFQSYSTAWEAAFARAFRTLNLAGDPAAAANYWIRDMGSRAPYPEVSAALAAVAQHWPAAVLSNADDVFLDPPLERLDFPFSATMSSEGARCYKPNPELFLTLLRRLAVEPGEAVYVGDRQYEDVYGASQAGMRTVWVNRSGAALDPTLKAPDYQAAHLLELPAMLNGAGRADG